MLQWLSVALLCAVGTALTSASEMAALAQASKRSFAGAYSLPEQFSHYWTANTIIDSDSPVISAAAAKIMKDTTTPREAAVAIHDWVRETVPFGWSASFHKEPASQVLGSGIGFCLPKSTLFAAMLRAAGIPCRVVFVDISAGILKGFFTRTALVDHSYVEVLLPASESEAETLSPEEREYHWRAVDSFIVDESLFAAGQAACAAEGLAFGYGVHTAGTTQWDGRSDAFSQFLPGVGAGTVHWDATEGKWVDPLPTKARLRLAEFAAVTSAEVEPRLAENVVAYYDHGGSLPPYLPRVDMSGMLAWFFGVLIAPTNARVQKLRTGA